MFIVLGILVVIALAFVFHLSRLPKRLAIERRIRVRVPAQQAFDKIRDFKSRLAWSPLLLHEQTAQLEYSADQDQVHGWHSWDGKIIGAGKLTHLQFDEPNSIIQSAEFTRPHQSKSEVYWQFKEDGDETEITWGMHCNIPFFSRPMVPVMEGMIGFDYTLGLAMLKGQLDPTAEYPHIMFGDIEDVLDQTVLSKKFIGSMEEMKQFMAEEYPKLLNVAHDRKLVITGAPLSIYHHVNQKNRTVDCDIAIPVKEAEYLEDEYKLQTITGGRFFKVTLQGSYNFLELTWACAQNHLRMRNVEYSYIRPSLEIYENDPLMLHSTNEIITTLYLPVR